MRITVKELKQLIREAVKTSAGRLSVDEHPSTFDEYRMWIAGIARQAGAGEDIVTAIADRSDVGSSVAAELHAAWRNAAYYFESGDPRDVIEGLEQLANVHDVLLDLGCSAAVAQGADDMVADMVNF